jgi:hypothetical protein
MRDNGLVEAIKTYQMIEYTIHDFTQRTENFESDLFEMIRNTKWRIRVEPKNM